MRSQKLILSILFSLIVSVIPTAGHAVEVTINGGAVPNPFTGSVGGFQIDSLQVVAVPGVPNLLSLTAAQITNTGTASATLTIVYQHDFGSTTGTRFHGASMDGSFFDPSNLLRVVSGDQITKESKVAYGGCSDGCFFTAYDVPQSYTVPISDSPSANGFGPLTPPQASGSLFSCEVACAEILQSTVTITLGPGESLGLIGSLTDVAAPTAALRDQTLRTFGDTRFAEFLPKVEIELRRRANHDEFEVKAFFRLAKNDGINPLTEDVRLSLRNFSRTIPAGSFKKDRHGRFKFEGVIDGVKLEAQIRRFGPTSFEFKAEGENANLAGFRNPVPVKLRIGNNYGIATVNAKFD